MKASSRCFKAAVILIFAVMLTVSVSCSVIDSVKTKDVSGKVIGLSQLGMRNSFYNVIMESAKEACDSYGVTLISRDADLSVTRQISDIQNLIDMDVDALIINPIDASSLKSVIDDARSLDIPVVVIDNYIDENIEVDVRISADNYGASVAAGKWLAEKMKYRRIDALVMSGISGTLVSEKRRSGLFDGVMEYQLANGDKASLNIAARKCTDWSVKSAYRATLEIIEERPSFNCILSEAQTLAVWCVSTLKDHGISTSNIYIACSMTDTQNTEATDLITKGQMVSGYQNPYMFGKSAVEACVKLWRKEKQDAVQYQPTILITADNFYTYFDKDGNYRDI